MQRIYTPETGFTLDRFVNECCAAYQKSNGKLVVNVSEGVQENRWPVSLHERLVKEEASNKNILSTLLQDERIVERAKQIFSGLDELSKFETLRQGYAGVAEEGAQMDAHGNIAYGEIRSVNLADWLAGYLQAAMKEKLGIKKIRVRGNTFGYMQRCPPTISSLDLYGAKLVGEEAAKYALEHISGGGGSSQVNKTYGTSIVLTQEDSIVKGPIEKDKMKAKAVPLSKIADLKTGHGIQYTMPSKLIGQNGPKKAFLDYSRPLVECEAIRTYPSKYITLTDRKMPAVEKKARLWSP